MVEYQTIILEEQRKNEVEERKLKKLKIIYSSHCYNEDLKN